MSYTQEQLTALKDALAKGLRSVSYDGHSANFQSADEMRATIAEMERDLGITKGIKRHTYQTGRGFR